MFSIHRITLFPIATLLIALNFAGSTQAHPVLAQGGANINNGFAPQTNGFSFQNYGSDAKYTNLTPVEVRRLFGDQVCASLFGDKCTLVPPAQEWMDKMNADMNGGHCEGMAVLSSLLYEKKIDISQFGASQASDLKIDGNDLLQREIAYWFVTQGTTPVSSAEIKGSPTDILNTLKQALTDKSEDYTVGIAKPDGSQGHAITAYGVSDQGAGVWWIMVYDNNYPAEARHIVVDTNANTWTYTTASDPTQSADNYMGDATTQSLTLTPDASRLQKQDCPFCTTQTTSSLPFVLAKRAAAPQPTNEIILTDSDKPTSAAHLLITDSKGNKLGYDNGKLVNTIPGARYVLMASGSELWKDHIEPLYYVPVGIAFTIKIDGSGLTVPDSGSVTMIGPGVDLSIDDIQLNPGNADSVMFSADGKSLSYTPTGTESPTFSVGATLPGADYGFEVKGIEVDKGASINLNLNLAKGQLAVHSTGNTNPAVYTLFVERIDDTSDQTFQHDGISLDPGATIYVDYGKWDGKAAMPISIDKNSDGNVDQTVDEPNQSN